MLLAEDCLDTRELYRLYLEAAGLRVATAEDGSKALQMAVDLLPDVIVMDLSMPRLNGDAVAAELKIGVNTRQIPIILVTAYGDAVRTKADAPDYQAFLTKPCLPETLLSVLADIVALRC